MKKHLGKLISVLIIPAMILASAGTVFATENSKTAISSVSGTTPVARIGSMTYTSLQEAINEAPNGATVVLLQDINIGTDTVYFTRGKDVSLTVDFNDYKIEAISQNVIFILNSNVTIKNARIVNSNKASGGFPTGIFAADANVTVNNATVITYADDSVGYYCDNGAKMTLNGCIYWDSGFWNSDAPRNVKGCFVNEGGTMTMNDSNMQVHFGNGLCAWGTGTATVNRCYMEIHGESYSAIHVTEGGNVTINDGSYFGDPALWINDGQSKAVIKKGEFRANYLYYGAIRGFDPYSFGTNIKIASGSAVSPSNWKTQKAGVINVYKKYSAPKTVTPKLKAYNKVSLSWSKVSGAAYYRVYYKKATASAYKLLKTTTANSFTKAGLSSGVKYQFKVCACDKSGSSYFNSSSKGTSIYTLKKLSAPKVTKRSGNYVKVAWKNVNGETGYQISKSASKTGTKIVCTYKTTNGTCKNVKAVRGKTYYYKVRAYKTVGNSKIYAPWSTAKAYKLR